MVERKLTNSDILSLSGLYNSGLSSWAIAKKFDTDHSNIIYHLKRLGLNRRSRSSAAKEGVKAGRIVIKKNRIPNNLKLDKNFAYIIGVLCGDGYMDYNDKRRTYQIALSVTDKEFLEQFKKALFKYFEINPTNEFKKSKNIKWKDQFATRLCSKEACDFINKFGDFKKFKWRIPEVIINSNIQIKCSFIKGFFDSEGEIDKRNWRIGATSVNLDGLNQVGEILRSLGMRYTIIKTKDNRPNTHQKYRLRIHDKKSINLFQELIGFTILRKQKVLIAKFPRDRDRLTP